MSDLDDATIVKQCLDGNVDLFEHLVTRYERMVYAFCLRKIADLGVAQDTAQETFLIGFENLNRLKDHDRFKSWLMGIAANLVRDHYKKRKMVGLPETYDPELTDMDPLASVEEIERHELLYKALQSLPDRYRTVLMKRYIEEQEYGKIADDLGLSVGAVEVSMHRARKALAGAMKHLLPEIDEV